MSQDEMERKTHNLFANQGTRKQSLFAAVDTDNSGQIDKAEFGKLYDLIKLEVNAELAKEAELKKDATRSKRQLKMVGVLALSLLVTLTASVLSTAGITYSLLEANKEVYTSPSDDGFDSNGAVMTTRAGGTLAAGRAMMQLGDAKALPSLGSAFNYLDVGKLSLPEANGVVKGYVVQAYTWYNSTDMDLMLSMDKTFHITAHGMYVTPTSSAVDRRRLAICGGICSVIVAGIVIEATVTAYGKWRNSR